MKHRLHFLASLRTSLHALGGGKILMAERQTLEDLDAHRADSSSQLLLETKCEPALAGGMGPRILLKAVKFDMMCNRRLVPKWVNFDAGGGAAAGATPVDAGRTPLPPALQRAPSAIAQLVFSAAIAQLVFSAAIAQLVFSAAIAQPVFSAAIARRVLTCNAVSDSASHRQRRAQQHARVRAQPRHHHRHTPRGCPGTVGCVALPALFPCLLG
jgi:hypothetical protein